MEQEANMHSKRLKEKNLLSARYPQTSEIGRDLIAENCRGDVKPTVLVRDVGQ